MKKSFLYAAAALVAMTMSFAACENVPGNNGGTDPENPGKPSEQKELTPEESKEKLMGIAQTMTGRFQTEDQKAAIELADGLYEKFRDYNFEAFEDHFEQKYEHMFDGPRYIKEVLNGRRSPAGVDETFVFSFEKESVVFEADDATRTWRNLGPAKDNSITLRFKDKDGNECEAKCWGEGKDKEYKYTYEDYHWEAPVVYVEESAFYAVNGYFNGNWRELRRDENGRWFYIDYEEYDYETGEYKTVYVNLADGSDVYGYSDDYYYSCQYDKDKKQFFYYDWSREYKVVDGTRTFRGVVPQKVIFTLTQAKNEIIRFEYEMDLEKNNHANFAILAKLVNLSWTMDVKIGSTSGSCAFAFLYGTEKIFSAAANLPSYRLIDKQDEQSYEDWIRQYEERYEELIKAIGEADAVLDLGGEAQIRVKINNAGYAYRDIEKWDRNHRSYTKEGAEELARLINENQSNGLYYNSDVKQAEVRAQVGMRTYEDYEPDYFVEGVLYFPVDSTTYAFEEYFNRKPFTDLQYTVEDLANAYIRLSHFLYDEVGEIHF